jgi:phage shock protein A
VTQVIASQNADEKARLRDEIEALDKKSDELISQVEALARTMAYLNENYQQAQSRLPLPRNRPPREGLLRGQHPRPPSA